MNQFQTRSQKSQFHHSPIRKRCRGWTLLETVIVMLIVSILASVTAPRFIRSLALHRVEAAAERIKIDCEWAQRRARTQSADQSVQFNPAADSYTLPGIQSLKGSPTEYTVNLNAYPYAVSIAVANFDGQSELVFDGFGVPENTGVIVVTSGSFSRMITIEDDSGKAIISEL